MIDINEYLKNFYKGTKKQSLDAMKFFVNYFDNFDEKMKFIHIAGTNGKGSCTEMISNILIKEGYKVGKFLSPHLIKYNERISINGVNISDFDMKGLVEELKPLVDEYNEKEESDITLFELETTMALLYFYRNKVDFVVLETGLGGLYDCTNIIKKPIVSIITSIGYDHMHILGNTLPEIAYQKAGIIKEGSNTVIFNSIPQINEVFIKECTKKNNKLYIVNKNDISNYKYDNSFQYFDYKDVTNIVLNLKGKIQVENASLCVETMKILNKSGYSVSIESIKTGLRTVIHKARMEKIMDNPTVIFDGAHNEPAMKNFIDMVKMYYKENKRKYIISILKRKDYDKMLKILSEDKDAIYILTSGNNSDRFATSDELYECMKRYVDINNISKKNLKEAINEAINGEKETINFIVGSFYTYGEVVKLVTNINV